MKKAGVKVGRLAKKKKKKEKAEGKRIKSGVLGISGLYSKQSPLSTKKI